MTLPKAWDDQRFWGPPSWGRHWRRCKTYGRLIGYPMLKPHDLRHGVAMEVLERHHDLEQVRALLGHARREHRLRCPESLRDVPVSARIDVPLPDRLVLLALEFFGRPKLFRRHVVTRDLIPHWHPAQFRVAPMVGDAIRAVERLTEA